MEVRWLESEYKGDRSMREPLHISFAILRRYHYALTIEYLPLPNRKDMESIAAPAGRTICRAMASTSREIQKELIETLLWQLLQTRRFLTTTSPTVSPS